MKPRTTLQDPLYRRIVERLEGLTDHTLFERCACSLLREIHPSLVPVSGGNDAGQDGAIADGEAEAFALVSTTGQDFTRNLRESLDSQARKRFPRHKAVFATSRRLTPPNRKSLEEAARERKFVLVQIVDQEGIAELLYRSSRWRSELGITGSASALSAVPKSRRPFLSTALVGRAADLEWLRTTQGDRILSGQPGSGKTFLLRELAREGVGLFLVRSDEDAIKDAILDLRLDESTEVGVLVDDAHARLQVIASLRNLREQMGGSFPILATCWPGAQEEVTQALAVDPSKVHQLELLTRQEIAQVYAAAGVTKEGLQATYSRPSPEILLRQLIDQAANKPGLAMTLASMVLKGDEQDVFSGRSLLREIRTLEDLLGADPLTTLASFAVGGEAGMPMAAVAEFRNVALSEIQEEVIGLATGGALADRRDGNLAVEPRVLRSALLSEVFFREGSTGLPITPLLEKAPDPADALSAVIWSQEAGATIDDERLLASVEQAGLAGDRRTREVWALYASSGEQRAERAAARYPGDLLDIGAELLQAAPDRAVSWVIKATGDPASTERGVEEALEILSSWIRSPEGSLTPTEKRLTLVHQVKPLLATESLREAAFRALLLIFSTDLEETSLDPILGSRLITRYSGLQKSDLEEVRRAWEGVRGSLPELHPEWASYIDHALRDWLVPRTAYPGFEWTPEEEEVLQTTARAVLADLAGKAGDSFALRSELERQAARSGGTLGLKLDAAYEVLFPDSRASTDDFGQWKEEHLERVRSLAQLWSSETPASIAARLKAMESEALVVGRQGKRLTQLLCSELAGAVLRPQEWLEEFDRASVPDYLVQPFLQKAAEVHADSWAQVARRRLRDKSTSRGVFEYVLSMPEPAPDLLEAALAVAPSHLEEIETLCLRREIPLRTLELLLEHQSREVACCAAIGEWCSEDVGAVKSEIRPLWQKAVLRSRGPRFLANTQYWLGEILARDSDLAFHWLKERISDGSLAKAAPLSTVYPFAIASLDSTQRTKVLASLSGTEGGLGVQGLIRLLVGDDIDLFRALLARRSLQGHHLKPLAGKPGAAWAEKGLLAVGAGYEPREIARQTIWGSGSITIAGDGVSFWQGWLDGFAEFVHDPRPELREIAKEGIELVRERLETAQEKKRERELVGHF